MGGLLPPTVYREWWLKSTQRAHANLRRRIYDGCFAIGRMSGVECCGRNQSDNSNSKKGRNVMAGTYKITELVGTSPTSFAEAVRAAVAEAAKTVRNMAWFEVVDQRGRIDDGKVAEFQVTIKIGFKVER